MLRELARIADAFRPWGVRMSLSVDLSSPQVVGGLPTFDPVDPAVAAWWQQKVDEIYQAHPRLRRLRRQGRLRRPRRPIAVRPHARTGRECRSPARSNRTAASCCTAASSTTTTSTGTTSKPTAPAPATTTSTPSTASSNPTSSSRSSTAPSTSRSASPSRRSSPRSGTPTRPSNSQTTQEYTGQQRHMVFLVPMWKTALDTDMRAENRSTPVKEIVEGKSFHQPLGGFVAVVNVGLEDNWLHHPMAMANLYGFGKLAWNPDLTSDSHHRQLDAPHLRQQSHSSSPPSTNSSLTPGTPTSSTPARSASARSPTSSASTTAPASSPPNATAGASGSAPTTKASAWTAP